MKVSERLTGFSFALRLLTLVLVPLLALGVLSVQRIESEQAAATSARRLVDEARLQQSIAAVYAPAQLEQIALEGLATIDELGVPREFVVAAAGVDFESTYGTNAVQLDLRLDELARDHSDAETSNGSTLGERLSFIRGELAVQRRLSDEGRATQTDVRTVFAGLEDLLSEALVAGVTSTATGQPALSSVSTSAGAQLTSLNEVLSTAGDRGTALLNGLLDPTAVGAASLQRATNRLDFAIERCAEVLAPAQRERFDQLIAELKPVPEPLTSAREVESIAVDFDPNYIETSASAVLDQVAFLGSLEEYSNEFHTTVVDDLEHEAVDATAAAARIRLLAAVVAILSLTIVALLAFSTLRPLRRLTLRAQAISDGSFDVEPLEHHGPRDVRILTSTMNSMTATLRSVDQEVADLASGASSGNDRHIPGAIGVSISQSFDRIEAATSKLHASEQLAVAIIEQAADAIWTIDEHGMVTMANQASVELTGISADEQIGMPLRLHVPNNDGEATITTPSGETARLLVASSEFEAGDRPLTTVIARDISERLRFEEKLAYQAHHDALTGLPNRFAVLEALSALGPEDPLAVLFVDLDGFKSVNDTHGHVAGDRVLTEVGRRLSDNVRPGDFVGRLGGDEFVVIMHDIAQDSDATSFGYRLIREIEQPYDDENHLFSLSASIGIAMFSRGLGAEASGPLDAIRRADSAVYAAKRRGRGRVEAFDERLQAQIVQQADIELALRSAVRNDELELHLQPVHDVVLQRFTGVEALVRWNRPGHGMVSPGDFIPVAERSSLIDEIGRWVLTTACSTLARWAEDDRTADLTIAVNIAGSHLLDGDLVHDLDGALHLTGADPRLLEFELTETQLMEDHTRAADILEQIRARGINVAIDDFGTGYSSMAYLRGLPIDTLKIDRSFIAPIGEADASGGTVDTTVVDALLSIGHALGLSVVAEGVETQQQLDYVGAHGADRIQGFFLARPMPIADAERFLHKAVRATSPTS